MTKASLIKLTNPSEEPSVSETGCGYVDHFVFFSKVILLSEMFFFAKILVVFAPRLELGTSRV